MVKTKTRPLSDVERKALRGKISSVNRNQRAFLRRAWISTLVINGIMCTITILASNVHWSIIVVVWLVLALIIGAWLGLSESKRVLRKTERLRASLDAGEVREFHIFATGVVEFEEKEDEGACFAFQVDTNQIVFVSGQEFYSSTMFPNNDFALVEIYTQSGELVDFLIQKNGTKLKPSRIISAETKSKLIVPEHLSVISGTLPELEELLAA